MSEFTRAANGRGGPLVGGAAAPIQFNNDSRFPSTPGQDTERESSDHTQDSAKEKDLPNGEGARAGSGERGDHDRGKSQEDGENGKDEEQQDESPKPVGFWHPSLKHVRHEAMTKWTITTAILMVFILGVLSIYWAVFYNVEQNLSSLLRT